MKNLYLLAMSKLSVVLQCNKEEIDAVVLTKFTVLFYKDEVRQERNLTPSLPMALKHWRPFNISASS